MQSRGFRNYPHTLDTFRCAGIDWLASAWWSSRPAAAIWLEDDVN